MKLFNQNLIADVKRSTFDLSHERKFSSRMGQLVPVLVQEVVPGDKFHIDTQSLIRFAPMIAPVMHNINAYIHYFFVPNRIVFSDWEKLVTGSQVTVPHQPIGEIVEGGLADYMGLPVGDWSTSAETVNVLPFRAYFKIWNEFYRDENLQQEIDVEDNTVDLIHLDCKVRAWQKDYFTSALPWAQKGNPAKMSADIDYKEVFLTHGPQSSVPPVQGERLEVGDSYANKAHMITNQDSNALYLENIGDISVTVEELRRATRLQRWLERNARSGTRYVEHLLAHWGVTPRDYRLQRPEYIGGGKTPVVISEVLNNTGTAHRPQGDMAGHGLSVGTTNQASKYCEEHGFIIGIMSVIPTPTYQQGIPKFYSRKMNLDYYYPEFAQLGEQEVLNKELFFTGHQHDDNEAFGYQSRYAEYKYNPSTVHGAFRSTLDFWHLGRKFQTAPTLGFKFITCEPDTRIFAVEQDVEQMYIQLYHSIYAKRPMPFFNDPKL